MANAVFRGERARLKRFAAALSLASLIATLAGCGGTPNAYQTAAGERHSLASIVIAPANPVVAMGDSEHFVATGIYADGTKQDLSSTVTWTSANPEIAPVDKSGTAVAKKSGSTLITAASGSISGGATLTIPPPSLVSINITAPSLSIPKGNTEQLSAIANYLDGSTIDITSTVTWASSAPGVVLANGTGVIAGAGPGTATITASFGNIRGAQQITVAPAALMTLTITPPNPSVAKGSTQQLGATGTLSDGTTQDLTNSVLWTASPATVTVSSTGLVTATANGTATVTATSGSVSASDTITVSGTSLVSIAVLPPNPAVINGKSKQLTAMATYSDASTQDITASASWSTSSPSVVNVSGSGLVTAQALGTAPVKATSGSVSGSAMITVSPLTLVSIAIAPPNPSIPKGETQQLVATGSYNDGSTQDITGQVSWSNTAPNIVGLSGSDPVNITAENIGAATLTATSGSISGSTNVTVSAPVGVALSLVPANPSVAVGITQQLSAVETFSDGTTQRLTNPLTWISENPDIATVDNSGLVTGQAEGVATIAASYLLFNGSATLTVTPFNYFLTESRATSNRYSYFANANVSGIDATFRITNPGATGQDLCAMVYVFAADQQMSECCGCRVTTNGLLTLSLNNDLNLNPLTGKVPSSGTVEVVAADPSSNPTCDPSTLTPAGTLTVWSTHIQNMAPDSSGDNGGGGGESTREPADPQTECAFVQALGSGQGICTCGTEQ
jgi:uncharacterized protein YjdB